MFLSLWAPSRLSFSLINSRPPQSNRCYGSNPSKFISDVKKTWKNRKPKAKALHDCFDCSTYWQPAWRGTLWVRTAHMENRVPPPPTIPPLYPPPQRQPSYSSPSSPQTSKTVLAQLSKVTALPAFRSISTLLAPFCLHCICGLTPLFLFSCRPSCNQASPLADTPTAEMIIQQGNNWGEYVFLWKLKNAGFLKSAFLWRQIPL